MMKRICAKSSINETNKQVESIEKRDKSKE